MGAIPTKPPKVLVVMDECSGISDKFYESMEGQAHRILMLSSPLNLTGYVARKIRAGNQQSPLNPKRCIRLDDD